MEPSMLFTIELEREEDGRWIGDVPALPGVMAYGQTREEALAAVQALALRVLADRLEHGEAVPDELLNVSFVTANKAMAELIRRKRIENLKSLSGKILIDLSPSIKDKKVKKQATQYHDLDALAGSWTKAEATAFDKALAEQRTIDPMQSKRN